MNQLLASLALLVQDTSTPPAGGTPGGAPAQQSTGGIGDLMSGMLMPILLCFGVFYFIILRPEKKQRMARQAMLAALKKGDKVLTTSGMYGTIVQVQDQVVTVQVAENV